MLTDWEAAKIAKLAYSMNPVHVRHELMHMFLEEFKGLRMVYVREVDVEGFVAVIGQELVVAFGGTESLKDLMHDLFFAPSTWWTEGCGWIKVHAGFGHLWYKTKLPLLYNIDMLLKETDLSEDCMQSVTLIGHSLGASLALGMLEMVAERYEGWKRRAITFGCPNGFSRNAAKCLTEKHEIRNFINVGDYVTWLLGLSTTRPGMDIKLKGRWGHFMDKYINNVRRCSKLNTPGEGA